VSGQPPIKTKLNKSIDFQTVTNHNRVSNQVKKDTEKDRIKNRLTQSSLIERRSSADKLSSAQHLNINQSVYSKRFKPCSGEG
jgi:hypothetical protein